MKPKYRVEAFIVPKAINKDELISSRNEIDDVKVANNKLKLESSVKELDEETSILTTSGEKMIDNAAEYAEIFNEYVEIDEPIYDVPSSIGINKFLYLQPEVKYVRYEETPVLPPKLPVRTSSLMSIDERGETDGIIEEFCFHGCKNGCTAPAQRPEQVSEEIFQSNWLRRLEILREREANLGEKENLLQERERLLFKKERELRILERLVKEKLKQAELYLKRYKSSQSIESANSDTKTRSSEGSHNSHGQRLRIDKSSLSYLEKPMKRDNEKKITLDGAEREQSMSSLTSGCEKTGNMKNPPNSRSSLWTNATNPISRTDFLKSAHGESTKNSFPAMSAYHSSMRMKPRPRINYDDLDSTLSADIGDSSFVITSRKFDPAVFKKPQAFTRSSSERRTRQEPEIQNLAIPKYPPLPAIQRNWSDDKIVKRVSENILVTQDSSTKYQDYGLIDKRVSSEDDEARNSYLNLERGTDTRIQRKIISKGNKERPNSWNEASNEWLQKKRHAYNIATMRSSENFENKENADLRVNERDKLNKIGKKKDSKQGKKFTIFR